MSSSPREHRENVLFLGSRIEVSNYVKVRSFPVVIGVTVGEVGGIEVVCFEMTRTKHKGVITGTANQDVITGTAV